MSTPHDSDGRSTRCPCGGRHDAQAHPFPAGEEQLLDALVEQAVLRAVFPFASQRRALLQALGASTVLAALSAAFPLGAAKALAQETRGRPEKKDLQIGFLPITCATPIIMAQVNGYYAKEGLNVTLVKTAGWAVVRDKSLAGEYDAAHMLSPMPLAMTLGAGSNPMPMVVPAIENLNGSAITLHIKHKDKRDPKTWKGMRFAIPFDYSMHNFLLRYYLAEHGVDPDQDVQLRVMPPPDMVANLRSEAIDGFIVAEPFNQRAVYDGIGYIHTLSGEIWNGHPCCAFATTRKFASQMPSSFAALFRALVVANVYCNQAQNRKTVAEAISAPNFLNQPPGVVEQVLTGRYADGLGQVRTAPDRITFEAFPYPAMAVWILTQMKRWGYLKGDLTYAEVAERVFLASDARRRLTELGMRPPADDGRRYVIMGKEFDPARADAYLSSFAIRRTT